MDWAGKVIKTMNRLPVIAAAPGVTGFMGYIHSVILSSTRGSLCAIISMSNSAERCAAISDNSVILGFSPIPGRPVLSRSRKMKVLMHDDDDMMRYKTYS